MKKIINYLFGEQRTRNVIKDAIEAAICASVVCVIFFILQGRIDVVKLIVVAANVFVIFGTYKSIKNIIIPNIKNNKNIIKNILIGVAETFMTVYLPVNTLKTFLIY